MHPSVHEEDAWKLAQEAHCLEEILAVRLRRGG